MTTTTDRWTFPSGAKCTARYTDEEVKVTFTLRADSTDQFADMVLATTLGELRNQFGATEDSDSDSYGT